MLNPKTTKPVGMLILGTAAVLTLAAIGLIIASLAWQGVVTMKPCYSSPPPNASCVVHLPRREGFFKTCFSRDPMEKQVDQINMECIGRDFGGDERFAGWDDPVYTELIELRRFTVTHIIIGAVVALAGLALICVLMVKWSSILFIMKPIGWLHLLTAGMLFLAAFLLQVGLVFLHFGQAREKSAHTKYLFLAYTRWRERLQMSTAIEYSHSYWMLLAALALIHVAGILVLIAAILQYAVLEANGESVEQLQSGLTYEGILPRYKTEMDYDEMVKQAE